MKSPSLALGLVWSLGLMLLMAVSTPAALVIDGEIADPSEVDWLYFTVESTQLVTIDILAREEVGPHTAAGNELIDLNGDGEITLLDTYIHLFPKQPSLTPADVIASNDDGAAGADGSTSPADSYLQLTLNAGDYILALGAFDLSVANAIIGFNPDGIKYGDYRVTITGAVAYEDRDPVIPEPASLALLAMGLTGLASLRRRQ